ncbi:MAG: hypothetical protein KKC20_13095 [Proteobacteria bacterium]|nr:hypothetical protein [Pseudomonadota bacterium]
MPFFATNAEKNIRLAIEHQCPQCGAPITLGEETLFFVCGFCRVRLCISQKGFPRYYFSLSPDAPTDARVIYLPYWRFKGVRYACHFSGVIPRFMDISVLAMEKAPGKIPFSLGFRSQALPLKRVSNETIGNFIRPIDFKTSLLGHARPARPLGKEKTPVFQEDIGETISLIYSPFYLQQTHLFDGILNARVQETAPADLDINTLPLCRPARETQFISGICPDCGHDLEGQSDSLVLVCRNCQTLWQARGNRLGKIRYGSAGPNHPEDVMIPFWKIKADIAPIEMASYADLVRLGNLPKALRAKWENQTLYFWAPAFKLSPHFFLRLITRLAIAQPDPVLEKKIRKNIHFPITLASGEAVQSIKLTLASLIRPLEDHLPLLARASVVPGSLGLVFLPFEARHHDYRNPDMDLTIDKNILALSGNL